MSANHLNLTVFIRNTEKVIPRKEFAPAATNFISKGENPRFMCSVSQSVISRSRPALTPPPARSPAPPLPFYALPCYPASIIA